MMTKNFCRWMAKAIYCLKLYTFRHQIKINHCEETALRDKFCFIIICYTQNWFSFMNSIEALLNDIVFLRKLVYYKKRNITIAGVALMKFCNHLWHLNEKCIMFSIFDERISVEDKRNRKI